MGTAVRCKQKTACALGSNIFFRLLIFIQLEMIKDDLSNNHRIGPTWSTVTRSDTCMRDVRIFSVIK